MSSPSTVLTKGLGAGATSSELLLFGFGIGSISGPTAIAQAVWNYVIEPGFSAKLMLRVIAAVAAGKTVIVSPTAGTAHVIFRTISDNGNIVEADVVGSERTSVVITP